LAILIFGIVPNLPKKPIQYQMAVSDLSFNKQYQTSVSKNRDQTSQAQFRQQSFVTIGNEPTIIRKSRLTVGDRRKDFWAGSFRHGQPNRLCAGTISARPKRHCHSPKCSAILSEPQHRFRHAWLAQCRTQ